MAGNETSDTAHTSAMIFAQRAASVSALFMSIAPQLNDSDSTPLLQSKIDRSMNARPIG